jgi:hypothetical protein
MVHVLFVILLITMKRKFDIKKRKKKLEWSVIDKYIKIYVKQCFLQIHACKYSLHPIGMFINLVIIWSSSA